MKLLRLLRRTAGSSKGQNNGTWASEDGVLDHAAFQREMQRWRALVDRAGGRFVLVVFEASHTDAGNGNGHGNGTHARSVLSSVVRERARLSDVVGAYDESGRRIAVILPETTSTGAAKFVQSVDELVRARLNGSYRREAPLSCEISHYPDHGRSNNGHSGVSIADGNEAVVAERATEFACGEPRP
jgi:GGDEF domain-containing protein